MRKATKTILSFAVVLIAGLNFVVPAFAQVPFTGIAIGGISGASGAGLFGSMAGMSGIDIEYTSDPVNDAMWNKLNPDSVYFNGEKHEATGIDEDVWDYITVDLADWLDAQSDFIINFAQTNNVTDNDSGTATSSRGYYGYPFIYTSSSWTFGPNLGPCNAGARYTLGNISIEITSITSSYINFRYYVGSVFWTDYVNRSDSAGQPIVLAINGNTLYWGVNNNGTFRSFTSTQGGSDVTPATNISYTSSTVDTHVFDGWENAKVKIPHSISGLTSGWTIPDFTNAINNLWEQGLQGQIVIEDTDQPVPPPPVPTTPLGDVPFDDWIDLWGQGIYQQLENQSDSLDFIGSAGEDAVEELESIDSNLDDLNETAESIDTNIGTGIGLLGGIKSAAESAVEFLEGIAEHVEELVEEIVEGTETLIAGILNQIPAVFGVIFGPIKQASSIWHYVVEWIQSISAPMSWMWSMASGTSYNIVLPIYASLAGAVVLAFYKRFGK